MSRLLPLQELDSLANTFVVVLGLAVAGAEILPVDLGGEYSSTSWPTTHLRLHYLSAMRIFLILGRPGATHCGVGHFVGFARHAQNIHYAHNYCQAQFEQLFMKKPINYIPPDDLVDFIEKNTGSLMKGQTLISLSLRFLMDRPESEMRNLLWELMAKEKESKHTKVKKRHAI